MALEHKNKVLMVVGTRPNMVKMAPLYHAFKDSDLFEPLILHTGQHMSRKMNRSFFEDLGLPIPHFQLFCDDGVRSARMGRMVSAIKEVIGEVNPDRVVVFGDVDSTLAGALAAREKDRFLVHIEAGLRSFDPDMPEELNRRLVDQISDELYITEESARINLLNEGVEEERIFHVGNLMIDSWKKFETERAKASGQHILWTIHRPSNTDEAGSLSGIIALLKVAMRFCPVIWPLHPRTKAALDNFDLYGSLVQLESGGRLKLTGPMSYPEFSGTLNDARLVVTDSGGVQEEACVAQVPCITLRRSTERPVTLEVEANHLLKDRSPKAFTELLKVKLDSGRDWPQPPLWDGVTARRIVRYFTDNTRASRWQAEYMSDQL